MTDHNEILDELNELINPDGKVEAKFDLDEDVQRHILGMLLTDRGFLVQSLGLVQSTYFHNIAHQKIHRSLIRHFERYKAIPHKFYLREDLKRDANADAQKIFFVGELDAVLEHYIPGVHHRDYLLEEIAAFAKAESMRLAFAKCTEEILRNPRGRDTWAKVDDILREARTVEGQFDLGLEYFQTIDDRYDRMGQEIETAERFTSGFPSIDSALSGGGLSRGEIGAWMGIPGVGKSLALTKGAVANLKIGKKVLYVSLEMDEDKIAARFDAQLARAAISRLYENREIVTSALKDWVAEYEDKRLLVIKQFAAGNADVNTIRAYHQQLKLYGFKPDLVVVDYVGEMKDIPGMAIHDSRETIMKQLRGFGVEEGHCTLTAVQPNRGAKAASDSINTYMDDQQVGDSYNQFRPLDAFWTINQNQQEKETGIGRIYVAKHRDGESRFGFKIGYDYGPDKCLPDGVGTLDMFEISTELYKHRWNLQKESDAADTQFDNIQMKKGKRQQPGDVEERVAEVMKASSKLAATDFDDDVDVGEELGKQLEGN